MNLKLFFAPTCEKTTLRVLIQVFIRLARHTPGPCPGGDPPYPL